MRANIESRDFILNGSVRVGSCLIWKNVLSYDKDGYPRVRFSGRIKRLNRVSYTVFKGEIPDGLIVRHTCDNPNCVDPDHLELGTHGDNKADAILRGRCRDFRGVTNVKARLTEADVLSIYTSSLSVKELMKMFNVSQSAIYKIKGGLSWRHITSTASVTT